MSLDTDNPEKGQLLRRSARHRDLLEEEVKQITERSEKMITNALIIGGALALTYFLISSFSSGGDKKEKSRARKIKVVESKDGDSYSPEEPARAEAGVVSQIGAVLMAQATGFLLSIAREKLVEFLQAQAGKKEQTNDAA